MKAGFVQFNPLFGKVERNLKTIRNLIGVTDCDLLVLPELCNTGYLFVSKDEVAALSEEIPGGKTTEALAAIARKSKCHIVAGLPERWGDLFYNSCVLVSPEGYVGTYRKVHLFFEENKWFQRGDTGFPVYDIGFCKVGLMICFDWIFPEVARSLALKGADILCHPATLVLPFCQQVMLTRCLENRVFSITANRTGTESRGERTLTYTGQSQIAAPDSSILHRSDDKTEGVTVVDIDLAMARDKNVTEFNNIFEDRRPEFYQNLVTST